MVLKCGQTGIHENGEPTEFAGRQFLRKIESKMTLSFLASVQDFQNMYLGVTTHTENRFGIQSQRGLASC